MGNQEEVSNKLSIENVKFEDKTKEPDNEITTKEPDNKITISIRNGSDASIVVDKIYINGDG